MRSSPIRSRWTGYRESVAMLASFALLPAILTPATAFASGTDAAFTFTIHGYYLIDFAVFLGIIIYFGRKPIAAALDGRYKTIVQDMDEAKELRSQAQARFEEYQVRLGRLEDELADVITDVQKGTKIECARILADARATADRITSEEASRIAQEGKKVRAELAAHAVDVALRLSTEQITKQLDTTRQQQLIDRVIRELEAGPVADGREVQA